MERTSAVIYLRQSLDREGNRLAVERQLQDCRALCERRGWVIVEIIEDNDVSASRGKRPGYQKLLKLVEEGKVNAVCAWAVDRLTRKMTDLEDLIDRAVRNSVTVVTVSGDLDLSTPMGQLLARIMASVARNEADQKGLRHRVANRQAAQAGKPHVSRRPFGYKLGDLSIVEDEAQILREMARRFTTGHSYKEIAYWANEQGYTTSEGKKWYPITIRNTLNRPLYAGIRVHGDEQFDGNWTPIFDGDLWEQIQLTAKLRKTKAGDRPQARKYLLTGLVFCGRCGNPLNGETKRDHPGRPLRRIYHCRVQGDTQKRRGCGGVTRNAPALEDYVKDCLFYRLDTPELGKLLRDDAPDTGRIKDLLERRSMLVQRTNDIVDDYGAGLLTREQMQRAKASNDQQLLDIDAELDELNRQRSAVGLLPVGQTVREAWEKSDSDEWRRGLLGLVIDRIILEPGATKPLYKNLGRFDPNLVRIVYRA